MTRTIVTIVGARPQFVKAAAVAAAFARAPHPDTRTILIHTGQHYDYEMSEVFFDGLELPRPDHHLAVGSATHGRQTGEILSRLEPILEMIRPDRVVVYGDTNSTLAGALAAAKLQIPVAHIEAGLRSFDRTMPEEINRICTDHVADLLFVPTQTAVDNLTAEGITDGVHLVGDVMLDMVNAYKDPSSEGALAKYSLTRDRYALATVHRAANTDNRARLARIFDGFARIGKHMPVVVPLHPRTRQALGDIEPGEHVTIVDPVGYVEMLGLENAAHVIVTDSGGVQKEAFWLGVPCVTLRSETEWPETLVDGWNVLVDDDPARIEAASSRAKPQTRPAVDARNASAAIVAILTGAPE
jgi:UDP-GlcNAc3NAcA epimerase